MVCQICGEEAVRDRSFGGGKRFNCAPCGGFYRISTSLDALANGRQFNVQVARELLSERREENRRRGVDPNRLQDLEPTLYGDDATRVLIYD